jgi:hypothetical protein
LTATSMRTTALLSAAWAARLIGAGRAAKSGWRAGVACCMSLLQKTHTQRFLLQSC